MYLGFDVIGLGTRWHGPLADRPDSHLKEIRELVMPLAMTGQTLKRLELLSKAGGGGHTWLVLPALRALVQLPSFTFRQTP
jgi:hypothetical protein